MGAVVEYPTLPGVHRGTLVGDRENTGSRSEISGLHRHLAVPHVRRLLAVSLWWLQVLLLVLLLGMLRWLLRRLVMGVEPVHALQLSGSVDDEFDAVGSFVVDAAPADWFREVVEHRPRRPREVAQVAVLAVMDAQRRRGRGRDRQRHRRPRRT